VRSRDVKITVQFLKYVSVSGLSAASDWVVFAVMLAVFGSPLAAQGTSRIFGGVVSFAINKYWSFQSRQHDQALIEAWRFLLLFIASYALSLSLFSIMTWCGLGPYLAKLTTDSTCFFFNFLVMRFWVYRPHDIAPTANDQSRPRLQPAEAGDVRCSNPNLTNTLSSVR
jgi:putative flippase GtrA